MTDINKGGRPVGAIVTTRSVLTQEMRESARLNKRMRALADKLIDRIEKITEAETTSERVTFAALESVMSALNVQNASVERMGKHLIASEDTAEGNDKTSIEAVRRELEGAK